jgi:hypothetical protein
VPTPPFMGGHKRHKHRLIIRIWYQSGAGGRAHSARLFLVLTPRRSDIRTGQVDQVSMLFVQQEPPARWQLRAYKCRLCSGRKARNSGTNHQNWNSLEQH